MINYGNICWFNTSMQAIMSAPHFESFIKHYKHQLAGQNDEQTNKINLINEMYNGNTRATSTLLNMFCNDKQIGHGRQEDAQEGLVLFLEWLNIPKLELLYIMRYNVRLECACGRVISNKDTCSHVYATRDMQSQFNEQSVIEYNCTCARTKVRQLRTLEYAPPIIIMVIDKYKQKENIIPALNFEIEGITGAMKYIPSAMIEHSGTCAGGHYYAQVKKINKCFCANDSFITEIPQIAPTPNTYVIIYVRV